MGGYEVHEVFERLCEVIARRLLEIMGGYGRLWGAMGQGRGQIVILINNI